MKANINVSEENEAPAKGSVPDCGDLVWDHPIYFSPQGSEDPIPVKMALMAEKPKLHKANFLSYELSSTGLHPSNRNFACLYKPAILQPKLFSPSGAFQLPG